MKSITFKIKSITLNFKQFYEMSIINDSTLIVKLFQYQESLYFLWQNLLCCVTHLDNHYFLLQVQLCNSHILKPVIQ